MNLIPELEVLCETIFSQETDSSGHVVYHSDGKLKSNAVPVKGWEEDPRKMQIVGEIVVELNNSIMQMFNDNDIELTSYHVRRIIQRLKDDVYELYKLYFGGRSAKYPHLNTLVNYLNSDTYDSYWEEFKDIFPKFVSDITEEYQTAKEISSNVESR